MQRSPVGLLDIPDLLGHNAFSGSSGVLTRLLSTSKAVAAEISQHAAQMRLLPLTVTSVECADSMSLWLTKHSELLKGLRCLELFMAGSLSRPQIDQSENIVAMALQQTGVLPSIKSFKAVHLKAGHLLAHMSTQLTSLDIQGPYHTTPPAVIKTSLQRHTQLQELRIRNLSWDTATVLPLGITLAEHWPYLVALELDGVHNVQLLHSLPLGLRQLRIWCNLTPGQAGDDGACSINLEYLQHLSELTFMFMTTSTDSCRTWYKPELAADCQLPPSLQSLYTTNAASVATLLGLSNLRSLTMTQCTLCGKQLEVLGNSLSKLEHVSLSLDCRLATSTEASMSALQSLPLHSLTLTASALASFGAAKFGSGGVSPSLCQLTKLTRLVIGPDSESASPQWMPTRELLEAGALFTCIRHFSSVQDLHISGDIVVGRRSGRAGVIYDEKDVMQAVARLPQLQRLSLPVQLGPSAVRQLNIATQLKRLSLLECSVTPRILKELRLGLPGCQIDVVRSIPR